MSKDATIDLRNSSHNLDEKPEFEVSHIDEDEQEIVNEPVINHNNGIEKKKEELTAVSEHDLDLNSVRSSHMVRIRFDKFVTLLAKYDFEDLINKFEDQDLIISTDLLADLANVPTPEPEEKKPPYLFIAGIVLGIIVTWALVKLMG